LVEVDGVPILLLARRGPLQEVLIVGVVVLLVEASRQTEISELDMTSTIEKDVIWLDVPVARLAIFLSVGKYESIENKIWIAYLNS